ncbi:hypothetical protein [Mycolicibacterium arenosum]|uniref:Uncharacterized protein n=1 Tax=Mycolicibacterium arenosum TaxID=2952157 RepID=A0ABT1M4C9_9MYCO|nr:hypothetical protein [Mycolicibacterium sp. CAU 1645]MCP9274009.1 hypothetical protein [Mycolicibacterium sp. CAU 1645]
MTDETPVQQLRHELLVSGLSDWVSLAEVQQIISHYQLADTDEDRQQLVLKTIGTLLDDGLMDLGELPAQDNPFQAWKPVNVALDRLKERFIDHYSDPTSWDYSIWLGLTDDGRSVAEALRAG